MLLYSSFIVDSKYYSNNKRKFSMLRFNVAKTLVNIENLSRKLSCRTLKVYLLLLKHS